MKFSTDVFIVKKMCLNVNVISGHFNKYLPVSNHSVSQNSITVPSI